MELETAVDVTNRCNCFEDENSFISINCLERIDSIPMLAMPQNRPVNAVAQIGSIASFIVTLSSLSSAPHTVSLALSLLILRQVVRKRKAGSRHQALVVSLCTLRVSR